MRWLAGQAAWLAQDLAEGTPCPVCGSPHHPQLARAEHLLPTEQELKASRAQVTALETQQSKGRENLNRQTQVAGKLEADAQSLLDLLAENKDLSIEALGQRFIVAQQTYDNAKEQVGKSSGLEAEIQQIRSDLAALEFELGEAGQRLEEANNAYVAAETLRDERERAIPVELRDPGKLKRRATRCR